jgi:hypothetical protein
MVAADEPTAPHVLVGPRRTFAIARVSVVKHSLVTVRSYYLAESANSLKSRPILALTHI